MNSSKRELSILVTLSLKKVFQQIPKKVEAVLNWPVPETVYDVRAFLGFVGYYRRFIKNFSKVALPLRKLLVGLESQGKKAAKHTPVDWAETEQKAFDTLKSLCCQAPILATLITSCHLFCILIVVLKA